MKPFDLEAAKSGAKVVTRDGCKIVDLKHWTHDPSDTYPVSAVSVDDDGEFSHESYTVSGAWQHGYENKRDLFMAPVTRTVYVNFYGSGVVGSTGKFVMRDSEETARDLHSDRLEDYPLLAVAVPVTIEA
jgi:hypothetical protein